jgi:cytoskeletal protein RodZ
MSSRHSAHTSHRDEAGATVRAARRRWRRHKVLIIIAAVPILVGGAVTAAIAAPAHGGPVSPYHHGKPTASASAGASASATASGTASSSASASTGASSSASASTGAGAPPAAAPNPNCTITVPAAALTAKGLATPYTLSATDAADGPCNEANADQTAFVQGTIYNPATGALSVYDPLVIDVGTKPAVTPTVPTLPAGAVVGIWFGYNGNDLTLKSTGNGLATNRCVNGLGNSVFTQYAYCNAPAFFTAVNKGIAAHKVTVPKVGTAADGESCMTTRSFALIDQDQSDNVTTQYLATATGTTAQNTPANAAKLAGATVLANPSDNALLDNFVDPSLGCTPWSVTNLAGGGTATSLGLDEIQANADQTAPSALVPLNDPMTTVAGAFSTAKTNLYRAGVDQPALPTGQTPKVYCQDMDTIQTARLKLDQTRFTAAASPDTGAATNLLTFLAQRLQASFVNLNCASFGLTNPVSSEVTNSAGAVSGVTFAQ